MNEYDVRSSESKEDYAVEGGRLRRFVRSVWSLYYDGFRNMTVGKTLWAIVLVKLFVFFVVMKLLFFPNVLKRDFDNDSERADHVRKELSRPR